MSYKWTAKYEILFLLYKFCSLSELPNEQRKCSQPVKCISSESCNNFFMLLWESIRQLHRILIISILIMHLSVWSRSKGKTFLYNESQSTFPCNGLRQKQPCPWSVVKHEIVSPCLQVSRYYQHFISSLSNRNIVLSNSLCGSSIHILRLPLVSSLRLLCVFTFGCILRVSAHLQYSLWK